MLPVAPPFKTFTGLDGKPLNNGYVYFGLPNQNPITAPVSVYWDLEGTIPASQPLRTMNGYIVRAGTPANVFIDGAYSEVVQDSKKRQVFYAPDSSKFSFSSIIASISNFAGDLGSSLVGFLQAGLYAVKRTVQDKLRETVSVKDFGAKGDNSTDDTSAFQAALDYIKSAGGGTLTIPTGNYRISSPLLYDADNLRLLGSNQAIIFPVACDGIKFGNPNSTTYTQGRRNNIVVDNVQVNQTNAPGKNGFSYYNIDELKLRNNSAFYGGKGTYFKYTYNAHVSDCVNILGTICGLDMDGACDKTFITRGQYGNTGNGIIIRGGRGIVITGGTSIERNQLEGILLMSGARETELEWPGGVVISGNYLERNCQTGGVGVIALGQGADAPDYCKGIVIEGNYLNWDAGNPRPNSGTPFICVGKCSEITVVSNRYVNGTNYILLQPSAFKARMQLLDLAGEQASNVMMRCEVMVQMVPLNISVSCDANGNGTYDLNLSPFGFDFTVSWAVATPGGYTPADPVAPATSVPTISITAQQVNANRYTLRIYNGPKTATIPCNVIVFGKLV